MQYVFRFAKAIPPSRRSGVVSLGVIFFRGLRRDPNTRDTESTPSRIAATNAVRYGRPFRLPIDGFYRRASRRACRGVVRVAQTSRTNIMRITRHSVSPRSRQNWANHAGRSPKSLPRRLTHVTFLKSDRSSVPSAVTKRSKRAPSAPRNSLAGPRLTKVAVLSAARLFNRHQLRANS